MRDKDYDGRIGVGPYYCYPPSSPPVEFNTQAEALAYMVSWLACQLAA